ncbi:DUF4870 domain-containing protein [Fodinicola feengrottensis]|uniref:DUF4870 domain-containing protein n=1 Tax=Fodinicola feengrottensis TaxID=435914 RepID=A0ABN2J5C5_9ACTN|nr:DUF4870 domain-containing protein [Fodinicola feengrottensis]
MTDPGGSQQPDFNKPNDPNAGGYGQQPPAGGYGQPPAGGYGQPGGYPPPAGGSGDDKTWLMVTHFGGAGANLISGGFLGWVAPLVAMLVQGPKSPQVRVQAVDALNHFIQWAAATLVVYILASCIGAFTFGLGGLLIFLVFATAGIPIVCGIIGGIKANNGEPWTYPLTFIKLVK